MNSLVYKLKAEQSIKNFITYVIQHVFKPLWEYVFVWFCPNLGSAVEQG